MGSVAFQNLYTNGWSNWQLGLFHVVRTSHDIIWCRWARVLKRAQKNASTLRCFNLYRRCSELGKYSYISGWRGDVHTYTTWEVFLAHSVCSSSHSDWCLPGSTAGLHSQQVSSYPPSPAPSTLSIKNHLMDSAAKEIPCPMKEFRLDTLQHHELTQEKEKIPVVQCSTGWLKNS